MDVEEKEEVKSPEEEKKEKKEDTNKSHDAKNDKTTPKQKQNVSNEELEKILNSPNGIEYHNNGLYYCTICKHNINSKKQVVTHVNSFT